MDTSLFLFGIAIILVILAIGVYNMNSRNNSKESNEKYVPCVNCNDMGLISPSLVYNPYLIPEEGLACIGKHNSLNLAHSAPPANESKFRVRTASDHRYKL